MKYEEIGKKVDNATTQMEYFYWLSIKQLYDEYGEEMANRIILNDYAEGILTPGGNYNE